MDHAIVHFIFVFVVENYAVLVDKIADGTAPKWRAKILEDVIEDPELLIKEIRLRNYPALVRPGNRNWATSFSTAAAFAVRALLQLVAVTIHLSLGPRLVYFYL